MKEIETNVVEVEIITDTHRVWGFLPTGEGRLSDMLNLPEDSIVLDNVTTTPVGDPKAVPIVRDFAQINKDSIAFAVPHEPTSTVEERQKARSFQYVVKHRHEVLVSLPPFAINGHLHLPSDTDTRSALFFLTQIFVPISNAKAVYTVNPRIRWAYPVIIINRRRAQIFWPPRKK